MYPIHIKSLPRELLILPFFHHENVDDILNEQNIGNLLIDNPRFVDLPLFLALLKSAPKILHTLENFPMASEIAVITAYLVKNEVITYTDKTALSDSLPSRIMLDIQIRLNYFSRG